MTALVWLVACGGSPASPVPTAPAPAPVAAAIVDTDELGTDDNSSGGVRMLSPKDARSELFAGGRPRLVNFWATWCGPCVAELPTIVEFAKKHAEIDVILVSVDDVARGTGPVLAFARQHQLEGVDIALLDDPSGNLIRQVVPDWQDVVPYTLFVGKDGKVAYTIVGGANQGRLDEGLATVK
jgi:thiol-disulfide isomerase/thioredoxin